MLQNKAGRYYCIFEQKYQQSYRLLPLPTLPPTCMQHVKYRSEAVVNEESKLEAEGESWHSVL